MAPKDCVGTTEYNIQLNYSPQEECPFSLFVLYVILGYLGIYLINDIVINVPTADGIMMHFHPCDFSNGNFCYWKHCRGLN